MAAICLDHLIFYSLKKVQSFTIFELMITLLIGSIVISMAYYVLFLFNRQFADYRYRVSEIRRFYLLETALQHDFEKADIIRDTLEGVGLIINYGDTLVQYSINGNLVMRESLGVVDSFPIKTKVGEVRYLNDTLPLVLKVALQVEVNREPVLLTVNKTYSAEQIMNAQKMPEWLTR
jgi:hypothetical protein